MMDDIRIFKLVNGEFCIGDVTSEDREYVDVFDMRSLIANPQGVQIVPFMFGNPKLIVVKQEHIIASTSEVEKGLLDFYKQQVTGLIVPNGGPLKLVQ